MPRNIYKVEFIPCSQIAKQQNQIDIYINNIKALAKMEGIDKSLISLVQDPNSLTFCTYID